MPSAATPAAEIYWAADGAVVDQLVEELLVGR